MNFIEENGKLRIFLEGRIDSNNAPIIEKETDEALASHSGIEPVIDVSKLEYISSAGLRILMKLQKSAGKQITVEMICTPKVRHFWRCIFLWERKVKFTENTRPNSNYLLYWICENTN